jgi:hypothetical protein
MKQRRLHLGDLQAFAPHISLLKQSSPVKAPRVDYDTFAMRLPFPADTKAFLYYYAPPERPRIAGEIRLRLATDDSFASFESGSDLLRINGRPWSRPLYFVSKYYRLLYERLREDRLVPDDLDAALSTFPAKKARYRQVNILYTLNDPTVVHFNIRSVNFLVVTEQGVEEIRFILKNTRGHEVQKPYTGGYLSIFLISCIEYLMIL